MSIVASDDGVFLYVEDERLMQDVVEGAMTEAGFEVVVASDGAEALRLIRKGARRLRGLITDVNLGAGIDGWEVARRARAMMLGLPVVYVSAAAEHEWSANGVLGSVMLAKPFSTPQLLCALAGLLAPVPRYTI